MNLKNLSRAAAWGLIALIVFVTVCPIEFRPTTETTVNLDRSLPFVVAGFLLIGAYPRRWKEILLLFPLFAFGTETLQFLSSTRHPQLPDATYKAIGALCGCVAAQLLQAGLSALRRKAASSA